MLCVDIVYTFVRMKTGILNLRIELEIKRAAKRKAAKEKRSLSNYVVNLISKDIESSDEILKSEK